MLLSYLLGDERLPKASARHALRQPWCWPSSTELQQAARNLGCTEPSPPVPGEVGLVGVRGEVGGLWILGPSQSGVELVGQALRSASLAMTLASRELPVMVRFKPMLAPRTWGASALLWESRAPRILDGPSYGLPIALAAASILLDEPVPSHILATGEVGEDGVVGEVDGLSAKVRAVSRGALGVTQLLVPKGQEELAVEGVEREDLRIVGVSSLSEACNEVWPEMAALSRRAWADPEVASRAAGVLLRLAWWGSPKVLDWSGLASAAEGLVEALEGEALEQALLAKAIACRHAGCNQLIPWPVRLPTRRVLRQRFLAHAVQSAADADGAAVPEYVERAREHLGAPEDRGWPELILLGAIGRALASIGLYEEAAVDLQNAVAGWLAIQQEDQVSYALCELLRIHGLLGQEEAITSLESKVVPLYRAHPRHEPQSMAFVALALGRAWAQCGRFEEARRWLEDEVDWRLVRVEVQQSMLRWHARVRSSLGKEEEALATVRELAERFPDSIQLLLAKLDLGMEAPAELVARLIEHPLGGEAIRRLLSRSEDPAYVAEHYRY